MTPHYQDTSVTLHHGDCLDVLRGLPDNSVDSVVTDPPYSLSFMGKGWDNHVTPLGFHLWCLEWAQECKRVLKPGGHMLAFGGTRTWHRLACAVEDAGFEVRDSIAWLYGSGFPKSLDVSKAIDKAAGAEREVIGDKLDRPGYHLSGHDSGTGALGRGISSTTPETRLAAATITAPATDDARTWQGWGTALKPAFEPIVVARKPLNGTVAGNVLTWGTGALNIDATRIGAKQWDDAASLCDSCAVHAAPSRRPGTSETKASTATRLAAPITSERDASSPPAINKAATGCSDGTKAEDTSTSSSIEPSGSNTTDPSLMATSSTTRTRTSSTTGSRTCTSCGAASTTRTTTSGSSAGRWPSNVVLDESQARELDQMSGTLTSGKMKPTHTTAGVNGRASAYGADAAGGFTTMETYGDSGGASRFFYVAKAPKRERPVIEHADGTRTAHPTVKPIALMRWLVRLVTPPGGTILEPFAGSGTTIEAALLEGFNVIGIEREAEYLPLIEQRIARCAAIEPDVDPDLFDLLDGGAA